MQVGGEAVDHGEEDHVQRLLGVYREQQVVDVRNAQLRREARVDGAALGAFLIELLAGEVGVDDVFRLDPQGREVAREHRGHRVHIEHARHADADLGALLHQLDALLGGRGEDELGQRVGHQRRIRHAEHRLGRYLDKVGIGLLDLVQTPLDLAHVVDALDGALLAGGDDEALRAGLQRNLGLHRGLVVRIHHRGLHVDERAQALILAEVTAGSFLARGLVTDLRDGVHPDEGGHAAVVPQAARFERGTDGAGLAAVLVDDHVGPALCP